jgi:hypothetical protein
MTTFKTIPMYPDLEISDCGTIVRNRHTLIPHTIWPNGTGYHLFHPGNGTPSAYVHRCVLAAHHRLPISGEMALHRDDDRSNNAFSNLYWGSAAANWADMVRNGRRPSPKGRKPRPGIAHVSCSIQDPATIREIRRLYWLEGISQSELARRFCIAQPTIFSIVKFKTYRAIVSEEAVMEAFRAKVA